MYMKYAEKCLIDAVERLVANTRKTKGLTNYRLKGEGYKGCRASSLIEVGGQHLLDYKSKQVNLIFLA